MFWICCGFFLICTWIAAWLTNSAVSSMLDEVDSNRLHNTQINPYGWYLRKIQKLWQLHRSIAPVSKLRKKYIIGISIGFAGFAIALIGVLISTGTATGIR